MKKFSAVWAKKAYRPGSANFESYKLCFWRNTIQVKPTGKLLCFYGIFAFIGLFFMLVPCFAQHDSVDSIGAVVFFGLIFLSAGLWGITRAVRRNYPVIDFNSDMFYPQGKNVCIASENAVEIPLREIEAINITSRIVRGRKKSYRCFTLSLRCTNQREFLLLEHGALKPFMRDAKLLAEQLDLPLPESDMEEKILAAQAKAAPFLLFFSLFWLGISSFMFIKMGREQDIFPKLFIGFFILIGVIMLLSAIKALLLRKQK